MIGVFQVGVGTPNILNVPIPSPDTLLAMFDSANVNGLDNVGFSNGDPISTYKNTSVGAGSLGVAADQAQAGGLRPTFEAAPGGIKGRAAVKGDGTQYLSSLPVSVIAQPFMVMTAMRLDNLAGTQMLNAFGTPGNEVEIYITGGGVETLYAGTGGSTGIALQAAKWQVSIVKFDGVASLFAIDGSVPASAGDLGTKGITNFQTFADAGGFIMSGKQTLTMVWGGGALPSFDAAYAYAVFKIGGTPQ
jgi:hypothetical protein